jgi:multicomponent Na+:H+ antiporter subunit C
MTPTVVLPVVIGGLYAAGVYLLLDRSLTRVLLGFLLLGNATNLLLLSTGGVAGLAPIVGVSAAEEMSDPLPQALILTAIVITFGVSAFLLAVIYRSWRLVRQEVVGIDEEDRRVAARRRTDADDLDPDDLDPDDLDPDPLALDPLAREDGPAGHGDAAAAPRATSDGEVERLLAERFTGIASDDVELPPTHRDPQ